MSTPQETYFANVNYVCNERCLFCAAGLADGPKRLRERPHGVTHDDVVAWLADRRPGEGDTVMVAGGEPTLHPGLLDIVRTLAADGARVCLFTNGLRLGDRDYAAALLDAGVGEILISLFGQDAEHHDAVTRRVGSFVRTLRALDHLNDLRSERDFLFEVRLLVARQTLDQNAGIVRLLHRLVPHLDRVSINRLILSADADVADAAVSWDEAAESVNTSLTLVREAGFDPGFEAVPLCVFTDENAEFVRRTLRRAPQVRTRHGLRYLDPFTATGGSVDGAPPTALALVPPCSACSLTAHCGGVEQWHVDRFGVAGLRPITVGAARGAP